MLKRRNRSSSRRSGARVVTPKKPSYAALLILAAGCVCPARADNGVVATSAPVQQSSGDEYVAYLLTPFQLATQPVLKQSVLVFGGRMNSGNLGDTFTFGAGVPANELTYDNYIVGAAYQRDLVQFNSGILVGAEIGLADRFGHYKICCNTISYSENELHSAELWGGVSFRHEGLKLFDAVRISPGFVFGLSAISNPIGQEGEHQLLHKGSARVLFYLGFEVAFALANQPDTELVYRVQHRSGAYGTLGGLKEGNNANVIGIRHRF